MCACDNVTGWHCVKFGINHILTLASSTADIKDLLYLPEQQLLLQQVKWCCLEIDFPSDSGHSQHHIIGILGEAV